MDSLNQKDSNTSDHEAAVLPSPQKLEKVTDKLVERVNKSPEQVKRRKIKNITEEEANPDGYDSDGEAGPFFDVWDIEGTQDPDEEVSALPTEGIVVPEAILNTLSPVPVAIQNSEATNNKEPVFIPIAVDEVEKMFMNDLKHELKIRNLSYQGKKDALRKRLLKALEDQVKVCKFDIKPIVKKKNEVGTGFPDTAFWKELQADEKPVSEPKNKRFKLPRAPTIEARDASFVPTKHNFSAYTFERPKFEGQYKQLQLDRFGKPKYIHRTGHFLTQETERLKGVFDLDLAKSFNLTPNSHPHEFVDMFLPFTKSKAKKLKGCWSFEEAADWSNCKAILAKAGERIYPDWDRMTTEEYRKHLGLYIFNGVSPSPSVLKKVRPQAVDAVHGNDFVARGLGANAALKHRYFKAFWSMQDPCIAPLERSESPNWKVQPLLDHMNAVNKRAWMPGADLSVDEMTMRFKGKHKDKRRITYKREGDGFQADALCEDGFTIQVYMRNHPAPKKYLKQGASPLHSRVLALFDVLQDKHHRVGMDNLYNNVSFCRRSYNHPKCVLVHGVTRKSGRGIPECVFQREEIKRVDQLKVRGTVKAAVVMGDPGCPNLIASSVYDTKPVHYLSMVTEELKWIIKERSVYNVDTEEVEVLQFLRMGHIDKYNNTMGHVDVADQLRGSYRLDAKVRNLKWWWSPMFWAVGVQITNAYVAYKSLCKQYGKTKLMSHLEFRERLAMAWVNMPEYMEKYPVATGVPSLANTPPPRELAFSPISLASALGSPADSTSSTSRSTSIEERTLDPVQGSPASHSPLATSIKDEKSSSAESHPWAPGLIVSVLSTESPVKESCTSDDGCAYSTPASGNTEGTERCTNTDRNATAERETPSRASDLPSSSRSARFAPNVKLVKDHVGGLPISTGIYIRDIQEMVIPQRNQLRCVHTPVESSRQTVCVKNCSDLASSFGTHNACIRKL
ncbi:hypothetical protein CTEN210_06099 [Chaetoceros tenuissimus]|uniref:SAP domain-containing protein n=1 Tax=Chaetoceros tenuissimus TaxID=426638 RepID=A0AAD3H4E0_9STRA|nr:hypothetical protein CTEN210_06099 [Chaetoceros tenuissimus]